MQSILNIPLGVNPSNETIYVDIKSLPHMLCAGTTGSGKSTFLHSMISSLLMKTAPDDLIFMMIDTKQIELTQYNGIPHLICPVITDAWDAINKLKALVAMMEQRYDLAQKFGAKDLDELNEKLPPGHKLPYILVVVDEMADLMMLSKYEIEESVVRLAQKARACGIHLVLATQSPRREVVTGLLKTNLPTRIAFATSSELDSRIILDCNGAAQLIGNGDCLYSAQGRTPVRLQSPYVSKEEINKIVSHWRDQMYWQEKCAT